MRSGRTAAVLAVIAVVVAADTAARAVAERRLAGRPPVTLFGGVVRFELAENAGAFLGMGGGLSETARAVVFVALVGGALAGALAWLLRSSRLTGHRAATVGVAVMIGGGLANLLDRLPDGRVTDYVVLSAGPLRTGVFNLADFAILAGALALVLPSRPGGGGSPLPPDGSS